MINILKVYKNWQRKAKQIGRSSCDVVGPINIEDKCVWLQYVLLLCVSIFLQIRKILLTVIMLSYSIKKKRTINMVVHSKRLLNIPTFVQDIKTDTIYTTYEEVKRFAANRSHQKQSKG